MLAAPLIVAGCADIPRGADDQNDLSTMSTVQVEITGRTTYTAYVAKTSDTQRVGLMNTTEAELPEDRGMIFVFDTDRLQSFWMRNTIIELDIAYIRSDGTIVKTYTMAPLDESGYPSIEPARFVLEVRGGQFKKWGIRTGDHVKIPASLFNPPS